MPCGAATTEFACVPWRGIAEPGGEGVLHPSQPRTVHYLRSVGGADLNVPVEDTVLPVLPTYLPQIRRRSALRGWLPESIYAVRARDVIGRRPHVLLARELRETVGLAEEQKLLLLLFDADEILERLWEGAPRLLPEIAEAGYDVVVAPSYSTWLPRPRTEFLYNIKRSLIVFHALQCLKVPAIPRIAWVIEHDARRWAEWASDQAVRCVALDLQTFRTRREWQQQVDGLALFDRLTRRQLRYLVNGPSIDERCADVYNCIAPRRVTITNSTLAAPADSPSEPHPHQLDLPLAGKYSAGREMAARCAAQRAVLARARQLRSLSRRAEAQNLGAR